MLPDPSSSSYVVGWMNLSALLLCPELSVLWIVLHFFFWWENASIYHSKETFHPKPCWWKPTAPTINAAATIIDTTAAKEGWALKNLCFWTVVLEKALESPLDCKEIKPVHPKGNQSWVLLGRTEAEAEAPNFGHLMSSHLNHWKRPWCWKRLKAGGEGGDWGWDG